MLYSQYGFCTVDVDISVNAKDYDNKDISVLKFYKSKERADIESGKDSNFISKIDNDEYSDVYKIKLEANSYVPRLIKLRKMPREKNAIKRNFDVYFVKNTIDTTYDEVDNAASMLSKHKDDQIQKQAPLLEYAYDRLKCQDSQYGIKVRYNYARILLEYCKFGFDTCEDAKLIFKKLNDDYPRNKEFFLREKINHEAFNNALSDIDLVIYTELTQTILMEWPDIEASFSGGERGYGKTGEILKKMCDNYNNKESNPAIWRENGKPRFAICRDAGVSFLLYSDFLAKNPENIDTNTKDRIRYIKDSIKYFELALNLGDKYRVTKTNLSLAKEKLDRLITRDKNNEEEKLLLELEEKLVSEMNKHGFKQYDYDNESFDENELDDVYYCDNYSKSENINNKDYLTIIFSKKCNYINSLDIPVVIRVYERNEKWKAVSEKQYKSITEYFKNN